MIKKKWSGRVWLRFIIGVAVVGICLLSIYHIGYIGQKSAGHEKGLVRLDPEQLYQVTAVLDGDTFTVQTAKKEITVRMLGINTPETVDPRRPAECYGKEASVVTKGLLKGHQVTLKLNPKREVRDKYGRYLAYVYRSDGLFVNEYLLENGFAREYTYGSAYSKQNQFRALETAARQKKQGLWGRCVNS